MQSPVFGFTRFEQYRTHDLTRVADSLCESSREGTKKPRSYARFSFSLLPLLTKVAAKMYLLMNFVLTKTKYPDRSF